MSDLLIGFGEVGQALHQVLGERREFYIVDPAKGYQPEAGDSTEVQWAHVAIPYTDAFRPVVIEMIRKWKPEVTVLHSTLPVGTTRQLDKDQDYQTRLVYSPVRGRHPNLARYLRDFPKWYSTDYSGEMDERVTAYFAAAGIQTRKAPSYEWLEWAKLVETFTYGYNLVLWQELERQVTKIPGNKHANLTALKNWLHEKKRMYDGDLGYVPIYDLVPGPIGGHCVTSNWDLLEPMMDPDLYKFLVKSNEMRK